VGGPRAHDRPRRRRGRPDRAPPELLPRARRAHRDRRRARGPGRDARLQVLVMTQGEAMKKVRSADGTSIAFETVGQGPPLLFIAGAFCDHTARAAGRPLAELLAGRFTGYVYDRRGRGESGDTAPYAVEREIEDVAAILEAAGRPAYVYGHSSGAVLALAAAIAGLPIRRLVVYE